jgi:hypothetical protein
MKPPSFAQDDLIRVVSTGQIGRVQEVHRTEIGYVYQVQVEIQSGEMIEVLEDDLALL